jgi:integrase
MDGILRRPSGIFVVRLAVPQRLRQVVGKTEIIASTRSRDYTIAKVVGAEILAFWRRRLLDLDRLTNNMDIAKVCVGSPILLGAGFLPLSDAANASGLEVLELLRKAADGHMDLFQSVSRMLGYLLPIGEFVTEPDGVIVIPNPSEMPAVAIRTLYSGMLAIIPEDVKCIGSNLIAGHSPEIVAFNVPEKPDMRFVPDEVPVLELGMVMLSTVQVESLRSTLASGFNAGQFAEASHVQRLAMMTKKTTKQHRKVSEVIREFIKEECSKALSEQRNLVESDLRLFAELNGDPAIGEVDRDLIRNYRDVILPTVPTNAHRICKDDASMTMQQKIATVAGTGWPLLSATAIRRRMSAVARLFEWLYDDRQIPEDINKRSVATKGAAEVKHKVSADKKVSIHTQEALETIFSVAYFKTGAGVLTRQGTYREFMPAYYWLPLMGLYMGGRLNELAQLMLSDLQQTAGGVWYAAVIDDGEEGVGKRRAKSAAGRRDIPLHPHLIDLGLIRWVEKLKEDGQTRLFPELRWDKKKGPSKDASRWFSSFLKKFGWERDGTRTFHSFRHTAITHCMNILGMPESVEMDLFGHSSNGKRSGTGDSVYRKSQEIDSLYHQWVTKISFDLPNIAQFDVDAGLIALKDALRRKESRVDGKTV